jgi:hypothetical protein
MIDINKDELLSKPTSVKGKIQRIALEYLREKEARDEVPTSIRFLFYELEQLGKTSKRNIKLDGTEGKRKGDADLISAVTWLRVNGLIPWDWLADESRSVHAWECAPSVNEYILREIRRASIDPWARAELKPFLLTESRGIAGILSRGIAQEYLVPCAGTGGMCHGFLRTKVARYLKDEDTVVGYIGDDDLAGNDIEDNARRVLEHATGRTFTDDTWIRLAVTADQQADFKARGIKPIRKKDNRHKNGKPHWAYEAEALGQGVLVGIVRDWLDELLPETLKRVHEHETRQRAKIIKLLGQHDY